MNSTGYFVWRNGISGAIPAEQLRMTDFVLTTMGRYVPAPEILRLAECTYPQASAPSLGRRIAVGSVLLGAAWLLAECFKPQPRPKSVRKRNEEPVEAWKKYYVSERDAWRCTYCQRRVTRATRHIDHSVSRRNGGSNHLNNLRTACRACNLEKAALNARQFRLA